MNSAIVNKKMGFIGCGNMASAILNAVASADILDNDNVVLFDLNPAALEKHPSFRHAVSAPQLCGDCDIIFICVKPQAIDSLFEEIAPYTSNKVVVSIVAGLSIDKISSRLGTSAVVRSMPNTPMQLFSGVTVVSRSSGVSDEVFDFVLKILSTCGEVYEIDESLQNASIPVHSSSPAFIFRFADDICRGAKELGFDPDMALKMFCATLVGSAKMMLESGASPAELEKAVTSKGGTTRAALDVFEAGNFDQTVIDAVLACKRRADELGRL